MNRSQKLLLEIRANPRAVRFADLMKVLEDHGVSIRPAKGSHVVARRAGRLYTIRKPGAGEYVHPKAVKHSLEMFGLWDE
jgi:predicted RNA binding protein YcfA (HicA-like mRNA interferase family)